MEELPFSDLGPYRLEKLLGRGGMGTVYRALDERLGRPVAVKHLRPAASADELRRHRFRREALTLARLSHPAIVQIFDVVETPDGDWIVMELLQGPTLGHLARQGPLPLSQLLRIAVQVTEGLAEAHAQGVLHRDLKSDNVMLHHTGHAKILDFGLAKSLGDESEPALSGTGQILGTVHAMSPEQAHGRPLDPRSDLFSLGVLIYEMAVGEPPFRGTSNLEVLRRIGESPHVPLHARRGDTPEPLSTLVDRLLEKSPEHRPDKALTVAQQLEEIAAESLAGVPGTRAVAPADAGRAASRFGEPTVESEPTSSPEELDKGALEGKAFTSVASGPSPWLSREGASGRMLVGVLLLLVLAITGATVRKSLQGSDDFRETWIRGGERETYELIRSGMHYLERPDKRGNTDQAIAAFEAALSRDEESASAHAGLALAYWAQHEENRDPMRLQQAEAIAERAVQLDEHLALARVALGTVYAEVGRYPDALLQLETALQLSPDNADAYRGLGSVYRYRGDRDLARMAFEKAVGGKPDDPYLRDELGLEYYQAGRYSEAADQFSKSIDLAPDRIYGYRNLSAAYYMQGKLSEAAEVLQKALQIKPEHSLYSNLGTLLFAQGLYLPAARAFRKALDHGGANFHFYWGNLADAYRQTKGHDQEARDAYEEAIRLLRAQPEQDDSSSRLALYLAKAGHCAEAEATLTDDAFQAKEATDSYRIAVVCEICNNRDEAVAALESALAAGFSRAEIANDPELVALRSDPRYHQMVASLDAEGADPLG